jgi:hypothetical protein
MTTRQQHARSRVRPFPRYSARRHRATAAPFELLGLEPRLLLAVFDQPATPLHGPGLCPCCTSLDGNAQIVALNFTATDDSSHPEFSAAGVPLSSVPVLNSNPSATAQLYLDFNGHPAMNWDGYAVPATPAYDTDGDASTFSDTELSNIQQIWARVAEKYSPFNINVTTVEPASFADKVGLRVVIGGAGAWTGGTYGGVAMIGSFAGWGTNIVWVFEDNLANGNVKYTAEAAAHEAGHAFGLQHQSSYNAQGQLIATYNQGDANRAPIMGNSYYAARGLWWYGTTTSSSTFQDDMAILSNATNGFGYRADDHGGTPATATALTVNGSAASGSGIIERTNDADFFSFTTSGGQVSFTATVAQHGPTLDLRLEIQNASGTVLASASTSSLSESITTNLAGGTYYLVVRSQGSYGDVGQYTITGTLPSGTPAPVANAGGPYSVNEGGSVILNGSDSTGSGLTYAWDLDGDGVFGETGAGASRGNETGATPTFLAGGLDGPSTYTVSLRVTDSGGQVSTTTATINILNVPPTLTIASSGSVNEGSTYTITLSSSDPGQDAISSWTINWGDGSIQTINGNPSSVSHVYADNGAYTISATATDEDGTWSANTHQVNVANVPPTLTVTGGGGTISEGSSLTLNLSATDPGADTISSWTINWGDGHIQTINGNPSSVSHVYADDDIYNITTSATDEDGTYMGQSTWVTVNNVAPTLTLGGSGPVNEGSTYTLTLSAVDPGADTISSWTINWGDGIIQNINGNPSSVTHVYADNGSYTISASAADEDGTWLANSRQVAVVNVPPTLSVSGGGTIKEGSRLTLFLSATDPGTDTISSWTINWGDGSIQTINGNPSSVSHFYADDGVFSITLSATDEDGTYAAPSTTVTVLNVAPTLSIGGASSVNERTAYVLSLSSSDPGADTITSWTIKWGDGVIQTVNGNPASVAHTYNTPGTYTILAAATDEDGTFGAPEKTVVVNDVSIVLGVTGNTSVNEGSIYTLNLSSTSPFGDRPDSWSINWGDGAVQTLPGTATSATHTYADNGAFSIVVSATTHRGTYRATPISVNVLNVAPTIQLSGDSAASEGSPYSLVLGTITDPGTDTVTAWIVNWGDGLSNTYNSGGAKTHIYADGPATYTISVSLVDEDGTHPSAGGRSVSVVDVPPTLALSGAGSANEGSAYVLNLSATDPGADTISAWTINWGDGNIQNISGNPSSVSHIFRDDGLYSITATATNEDGSWTAPPLSVRIDNVSPTIALSGASSTAESSAYSLNLGAISDGGADTVTAWIVDWGDGAIDTFASGGVKTHVYRDGPAAVQIRVSLVDEDGTHANAGSHYLSILNVPPVLNVTGSSSGTEGTPYTLNLAWSDAGDDTVYTWTINWGDGTVVSLDGQANSATHTYLDDGRYTISLSASDEDGAWSAPLRQVNIANQPPLLSVGGTGYAQEGAGYVLELAATDVGEDTISLWRIDWGDGTILSYPGSAGSASHAYMSLGSFTVRVSATDEDGTYSAAVHHVTVTPEIPAVSIELTDVTQPGTAGHTFGITLTYVNAPGAWQTPVVMVLGPQGQMLTATLVDTRQLSDGRQIAFTYVLAAPGGEWEELDNGQYQVIASGLLPDLQEQRTLGVFQARLPIVDPNPPSATLTASNVTTALGQRHYFAVTWADDRGIVPADLDDDDLIVTAPGGSALPVRLESWDVQGTSIVATYSVAAPGGLWDASDNGVYAVSVAAHQVHDIGGNAAPEGAIGSFQVSLPAAPPAGRSLQKARVVKVKPDQTLSGLLTPSQSAFYYRLNLAQPVTLQAILADARDARVRILNAAGKALAANTRLADGSGVLARKLAAGTYFVHVGLLSKLDTLYRLRLTIATAAGAAR